MTDRDLVRSYIERAAVRADGDLGQFVRDRVAEARPHAHAGSEVPEGARLRGVKQAVVAASRPVTSHQSAVNHQVLDALDRVADDLRELAARITTTDQYVSRVRATAATLEGLVDELVTGFEAERAAREELGGRLAAEQARVADFRAEVLAELDTMRARQDSLLRAAREALPDGPPPLELLSRALTEHDDALYEDIEDAFRGTRDDVTTMLAGYLDDLASVPGTKPVVDVGCGRGEWLELLAAHDIAAYGCDINQVVVDRCRALGLDVRLADAVDHLTAVEPGSVRAVTSFHVAEHLSLDTLVALIDAALLALEPGGLLILETPNPNNHQVGAANFYLDPTHLKPLHPLFLEFLVRSRGFDPIEVRELHGPGLEPLRPTDLAGDPARTGPFVDALNRAFASPLDYAVVARKPGSGPVPAGASTPA
jgi:O-antigen chain-terminating methyltransferase